MTTHSFLLLTSLLLVLIVIAYPLGLYITRLVKNENIRGLGWLERIEQLIYRLSGIQAQEGMTWKDYALALLLFNTLGILAVYALQCVQQWLPLNPQALPNVSSDSAINTAVSFVTNTNWQGYSGETTMSYLTQILALTVQNFLSAATGLAVAFAFIRGFATKSVQTIGNFWVDITRSTLYLLLPGAILFATFLVGQGVIQNFSSYQEVKLRDPVSYQQPKMARDGQALKDSQGITVMETKVEKTQILAMGPVASQEAIKILGTNGGGFFNANSAHPYENPTPLSNFLQMLGMLLIPAALCFTFGRMVGDIKQGCALLAAMLALFIVIAVYAMYAEQHAHPALDALRVDQSVSTLQSGGNMEGKETRFGAAASALFAVATTATSCGAVNSMHDSFTPLGGMMPLVLMQLGEVVFGGVGSGLYGMLLFAILTVFIAGLMVGRTPEYLGKKIQTFEIKMTTIAILVTPILVLLGTSIAVMTSAGKAGISNSGAHGFSEILYALTSAANNNGSAFAGLSTNTPFYNVLLAIVMWLGRFAMIVPILAIAGSLAAKQRLSVSEGSMPTHDVLFIALLIGYLYRVFKTI